MTAKYHPPTYRYDPVGSLYKFTGKERDAESGLDYFGARYLASSQGRFVSSDPKPSSSHVQDPQSWNKYSYTLNNPLKYSDPDGMDVKLGTGPDQSRAKDELVKIAEKSAGRQMMQELESGKGKNVKITVNTVEQGGLGGTGRYGMTDVDISVDKKTGEVSGSIEIYVDVKQTEAEINEDKVNGTTTPGVPSSVTQVVTEELAHAYVSVTDPSGSKARTNKQNEDKAKEKTASVAKSSTDKKGAKEFVNNILKEDK